MEKSIYTAVIIDDEKSARDVMQSQLEAFPEINVVDTADNGIDGSYIISKHQPDIAFVDIDMPGKTGVEILKEIHYVYHNIKVVFTTAHEEYAVQSIQYHPFGYLLKPIGDDKLKEVICHLKRDKHHVNNQQSHVVNGDSDKLKVSSKQEIRFIDFDEITHLTAEGNYTDLHLTSHEVINVSLQLGKLEEKLPEKHFLRINRSEVVNLKYVKVLKKKSRKLLLRANNSELTLKIASNRMKEINGYLKGELV